MPDAAIRQAILHATVAAVFVEALLGAWRIRRPESRLPFWWLALAVPFLVLPVYLVVAPFRLDDAFAARVALFASHRWHAVQVAGYRVDDLFFVAFAAAGTALFLRDGLPFLAAVLREHREGATPQAPVPCAVSNALRAQADALHTGPPALQMLHLDAPVLFVRGCRRCTLVLSTGLLDRLTPDQLQAALAHEIAHVRFRDPLVGWLLMAARLAMFWNPAVQLVARAIAEEAEHRADGVARRAPGGVKYDEVLRVLAARAQDAPSGNMLTARARAMAAHLHRRHVAARVAAGADDHVAPPVAHRVALVAVTLSWLLFFVV